MEQTEHSARQLPEPTRPFSSFVRFVACGGGVGVLSSGAVALLAALLPWAVANAVVTVVSTVLATELHARFTFGAGRRAGRREHLQSAGSAAAAYGVTCAAMAILHLVHSAPGVLVEQAVYLGASALAGVGRFVVLRVVVFAARKPAAAPGGRLPVTAPGAGHRILRPRPAVTSLSYGWTDWSAWIRPAVLASLPDNWQEWVRPQTVPGGYGRWTTVGSWSPCAAQ
jgi:putative flippase GtrA